MGGDRVQETLLIKPREKYTPRRIDLLKIKKDRFSQFRVSE